MRQAVHRTIADVTRDLERWSYNTAVAHCMELLNLVQRYGRDAGAEGRRRQRHRRQHAGAAPHADVWDEALDTCSCSSP